MPKISICVPCYNVEKYIGRCLDSLVSQTLKDIEIICVDDCSTDHTWNILCEYRAKYPEIKIYRHLENLQSVWARKTALSFASGDYILFVDGDDCLKTNACRILLEKAAATDADIVEFCCDQVDCDGRVVHSEKEYCSVHDGCLDSVEIFSAVSENRIGQMLWNKLYRASLIKAVYLRSGIRELYYKDDVYIACLVYREAKKYVGIPDRLYRYRMNSGNSRQTTMTLHTFQDRCKCAKVCIDWLYCFYVAGQLQEAECKLIKSKINIWCKRNTLNDFLNSATAETAPEFLDVYLNAWLSDECIQLCGSKEERVRNVCLYQVRILLDALRTIGETFGVAIIRGCKRFGKLKELFIREQKYDIAQTLEDAEF